MNKGSQAEADHLHSLLRAFSPCCLISLIKIIERIMDIDSPKFCATFISFSQIKH